MLTIEPDYRAEIGPEQERGLFWQAGWNVAACRISHILGLFALLAMLGFLLLG